jgi:hypothetical protein
MALRIEQAFSVDMDMLWRMRAWHGAHHAAAGRGNRSEATPAGNAGAEMIRLGDG